MAFLKTDQAMGDHCLVSASAIYKARHAGKLTKTKEGYDTLDPLNHKYIVAVNNRVFAQRGGISEHEPPKEKNTDGLEAEKLRADIAYRKKMSRSLDHKHSVDVKDTIPAELMRIWIGFFAEGIRSNFLVIGNRVARGDVKLRDRIEKEISKAIEKTIEGAERGLKKDGAKVIEALEEK